MLWILGLKRNGFEELAWLCTKTRTPGIIRHTVGDIRHLVRVNIFVDVLPTTKAKTNNNNKSKIDRKKHIVMGESIPVID